MALLCLADLYKNFKHFSLWIFKAGSGFFEKFVRLIYSKKWLNFQNEWARFYRMSLKFLKFANLFMYVYIFFLFYCLKQISDNRSFYNHRQNTKYLAINQITKYASCFHSFGVIRWFPNILDWNINIICQTYFSKSD